MAFVLMGFYWNFRRRLREGMALEFDEARGTHRGVPRLWQVWIQDEPSEWVWENIRVSDASQPMLPAPYVQATK
jgi:hypothetical protein